jgi:hypothetical protein
MLAGASARAQEASLGGRVVDASGGAVPGATVVLTSTATAVASETVTNGEGLFNFPSAPPGLYSVKATLTGFSTATVDDVRIETGESRSLVIPLQPGQLAETVVVEGAGATPLMARRSERNVVVEHTFVQSVPLNVRNPLFMILGTVGVTPLDARTGDNTFTQSATNSFQINGGKASTSDMQIDGAANLVSYLNQAAAFPSVDAVEELRVVTSAYAPEYGRSSGGVSQFTTRSGTNRWHGSGHEFFRDDQMDATGFNANRAGQPKPDIRRHQYGFTFGGPVGVPGRARSQRTFFFVGSEALREEKAGSFTGTVPTLLERRGDFSQTRDVNGAPIVIYDPRTTRLDPAAPAGVTRYIRDPFPGNIIPAELLGAVGRNILDKYPMPNQAGQGQSSINNYFSAAPSGVDIDRFDARVDHSLSGDQRLMFRYNYYENRITNPDVYGNGLFPGAAHNRIPGITTMLRHTAVLSSAWLFEHHFSFGFSESNRTSPSLGFDVTELGFAERTQDLGSIEWFPTVTANRLSGIGNTGSPQERNQSKVFQYLATASWLKGRHALKMGFDLRKFPVRFLSPDALRVNATRNFTGGPNPAAASATSGHGAADLLLGAAAVTNAVVSAEYYNHPYVGLYFQDEFRMTPSLTFTYGLRYGVEPAWDEVQDRLGYFDTEMRSPLADRVPQFPELRGGYVFPGTDGAPSRPMNTDYDNVDPRVGAAWALGDKTVVHGGFGIFHHAAAQFAYQNASVGSTRVTNAIVTRPDTFTPLFNLADPFVNGLLAPLGQSQGSLSQVGLDIAGTAPDQEVSYQINWSADVQRELPLNFVVTAGYSASLGRNLLFPVNLNQLPDSALALGSQLLQPVPNPFFGVITDPTSILSLPMVQRGQLLRPFPQFLNVMQRQAGVARSKYHAMQLTAERRFSNGLGTIFAYTLSKMYDNGGAANSLSEFFQNNNCFDCDWSLSAQDIRHVFRWSARYDLPFGPGRPWLTSGLASQIVGGWGVAAYATWDTGTPVRLIAPNDSNSFGGGTGMRPNLTGVSPVIEDRELADGGLYFNPTAFSRPAPFTFGDAPRLIPVVRNPGGRNLDLLIEKRVATGGATSLDFRVEVFNATNVVQFAGPGNNITNASFGRIFYQQVNTPRQVQLGVRFSF